MRCLWPCPQKCMFADSSLLSQRIEMFGTNLKITSKLIIAQTAPARCLMKRSPCMERKAMSYFSWGCIFFHHWNASNGEFFQIFVSFIELVTHTENLRKPTNQPTKYKDGVWEKSHFVTWVQRSLGKLHLVSSPIASGEKSKSHGFAIIINQTTMLFFFFFFKDWHLEHL